MHASKAKEEERKSLSKLTFSPLLFSTHDENNYESLGATIFFGK